MIERAPDTAWGLLSESVVTLSPLVVLVGLRLSAFTVGPAVESWVPSSQLAASAAAHALVDARVKVDADLRGGAEVTFYNGATRETETFFLRFDGVLSQADQKRIERLFRYKRTGRQREVDSGLLQILARLGERYQDHTFELVSAHRAAPKEVRTSKHDGGRAVDLRIRGAKITEVRDWVWSLNLPTGVGYYRKQKFIHLDWRPDEGRIAWDQRREGSPYRYHPRWSQPQS